jgi:plasmid stabilization system protein ParE
LKPIRLLPEAEMEIETAALYYSDQTPGLGRIFVDIIEKSIKIIQTHLELYPQFKSKIRKMILHDFPYSIFYFIKPNEIIVLAITHFKQKPRNWKSRLK